MILWQARVWEMKCRFRGLADRSHVKQVHVECKANKETAPARGPGGGVVTRSQNNSSAISVANSTETVSFFHAPSREAKHRRRGGGDPEAKHRRRGGGGHPEAKHRRRGGGGRPPPPWDCLGRLMGNSRDFLECYQFFCVE